MSEPFAIIEGGAVVISEAEIARAQILSLGAPGLPEGFGAEAQREAARLERRLTRIENALGLSPLEAGFEQT